MIILRKMLQHPQLLQKNGWEMGKKISQRTLEEFMSLIKQANYVVVDTELVRKRIEKAGDFKELPPSPPFKLTWIEAVSKEGHVIPMMFEETMRDWKGKTYDIPPTGLVGALLHEKEPGVFDVFAMEMTDNGPDPSSPEGHKYGMSVSVFRNLKYEEGKEHLETLGQLRVWCDAIQFNDICAEITDEAILVPRAERIRSTDAHAIRKIIRIVPKKSKQNDVKPITGTGRIDWSHRWEVRGHWRKVSMLGKDREGNYTIAGFTWVKEHERGPEDAELVKKIRVFRNGTEKV